MKVPVFRSNDSNEFVGLAIPEPVERQLSPSCPEEHRLLLAVDEYVDGAQIIDARAVGGRVRVLGGLFNAAKKFLPRAPSDQ